MRVLVTREQILAAFGAVADDPSFLESRGLVEQGSLPVEMLQAMALRPELLRAFAAFGGGVYPGGLLERSLKERVILTASRANACQFCTNSHVAIMRQLGIASDPLASLDDPAALPERERLAVGYTAAAMADSNRVPEALFEELKSAFTDPEIVELTFLIGFINMLNLFNNCLHVTYHDDYEALTHELQ
jgi:AhpD family alkylhydroperoxidase